MEGYDPVILVFDLKRIWKRKKKTLEAKTVL